MEVHRKMQIQYQRKLVAGWPHEKIMGQLQDLCGLPVAWAGCKAFTGGYDEKKLSRVRTPLPPLPPCPQPTPGYLL